jgi:cyanuric acid amidohydrolase
MKRATVHSFPMAHPADVSALAEALAARRIDARAIVGVIVKTEGNGLDNDWTRVMALDALVRVLAEHGVDASPQRMSIIVSGGCEGVTTPHLVVFECRKSAGAGTGGARALAIGHAISDPMQPEQVGTLDQVASVRRAVERAMAQAGLAHDEVEYVQVKAPWLSEVHQHAARARGVRLAAADAHASKPSTRAACALGVALALREVDPARVTEAAINADPSLFTRKAAVTAGNDTLQNEVLTFGMSARWSGTARVAHACLGDLLDVGAIHDALRRAGLPATGAQLAPEQQARVRAVLFKGDPARSGVLRGERQLMWHDSDVHALRHLRAVMSGVIGAVTGTTRVFVSAGAEHQGPAGGGTFAVFADATAGASARRQRIKRSHHARR